MTRPDRRQLLADDLRRLAGLAEAAVGEARLLEVEVLDDVLPCVAAWRSWSRRVCEEAEGGEDR
jgi:hypothetical protein